MSPKWYFVISLCLFAVLLMILDYFVKKRQKTRSPQQRRMYGASRPRQSLAPSEPTIYVSPTNLPPPPKYEFMAPPSYEEVVGVHYPNYSVQPISQPISAALAQGSSQTAPVTNTTDEVTNTATNNAPASITVTTEARRASAVAVRS